MPDPRDLVKQQFGAFAHNYVTSTAHATGDSLNRLLEVVNPQPHWRALDVATGGGHTALALAPRVAEVVASDLTPEMLTAAEAFIRGKGHTNVAFREADATALPFTTAEFDLVTCRIAPHHFPDCAQFVREVARVLKPGGIAAVIDNITPPDVKAAKHINAFEKLRDPSHVWEYSAPEWEAFFLATGLTLQLVEKYTKPMDFEGYCDRMAVPMPTRLQLRAMLRHAPTAAYTALNPHFSGDPLTGSLTFHLGEILIIGHTAPNSSEVTP